LPAITFNISESPTSKNLIVKLKLYSISFLHDLLVSIRIIDFHGLLNNDISDLTALLHE